MKKLFAIATATALLAGGSAFAADSSTRLSDTQMDSVSAAGLTIDFSQNNVAEVSPLQAVEIKNISRASRGGEVENKAVIVQKTYVSQRNRRALVLDF